MTMQTYPNGYPDEPESSKQTGTDAWHVRVIVREAVREYVGDGDGADETVLAAYDHTIRVKAQSGALRVLLDMENLIGNSAVISSDFEEAAVALREAIEGGA